MKKLDQRGLTGPVEIGLIVVFVVFVGFVAYRIGNARTDNAANNESSQSDDNAAEIALKEAEEDAAKEVEVPKEEEKKEAEPEPVVKEEEPSDPVKKEEPKEEEKKVTKIGYSASSVERDGDVIYASATLEKAYTGTCYLKLYMDGQQKLTKEVKLTDGNANCKAQFSVSDVPVSGVWELHSWFVSAGKTVEAWMNPIEIEIDIST